MISFKQNHGNHINHKNHSSDNLTFFGGVGGARFGRAKQIVFRLIEKNDLNGSDDIIQAESRQSYKSQKSQSRQFDFFWRCGIGEI